MISKLFQSQGQYEGFFNYQGKQISEKFTIIIRKKPGVPLFEIGNDKHQSRISMFGYGENDEMGQFILEGYCEIVAQTDLAEKEGLKADKSSQ